MSPDLPNLAFETDEDVEPIPPRYWWLKRILLAVGVLILALVALTWGWGVYANRRWEATLAKYRAAGQPLSLAELQAAPVPDEQNALVFVERAAETLNEPPGIRLALDDASLRRADCAAHLEDVGSIVQANAEALRLLHEARLRKNVCWNVPLGSSMLSAPRPPAFVHRELGRLVCLWAVHAHLNADDAAAIDALRDAQGLARTIDRLFPSLLTHLCAQSVREQAATAIESVAVDLAVADRGRFAGSNATPAPRAEVEALMAELLDEEPVREGWTRAFYGERLFQLEAVQSLMDQGSGLPQGSTVPRGGSALSVSPLPPMLQLDVVNLLEFSTAWAEVGLAPNWPAAKTLIPSGPALDTSLQQNSRLMSMFLLPSLFGTEARWFAAFAQTRMAATALAIRLYEIDHGRRPETLAQLVPDYLPQVPEDPFAANGRPLGYRPSHDPPLLYSIGPDGEDDRGAYTFGDAGRISDEEDIPFFLNGQRPHQPQD